MKKPLRIIISGGGTGGHIFPAISIANAIKELEPEAELLFVGAESRMEMQRIPAAGYRIVGLPMRGLLRPLYRLANIKVLYNYLRSKSLAKRTLKDFAPQVAVGVGGYASAATLQAAAQMGIPCLIQEQNSYAGITNMSLARKAQKICVAYPGMERFFPKEKIMMTGNPVRQGLADPTLTKTESCAIFQLDPDKQTILIIGGSLGARTINEAVLTHLSAIEKSSVQVIWQTGGHYYKHICQELERLGKPSNLFVTDFIGRMELAYKASDLVVSRAGASSISEICLLGKASILVPSPNVAEDHQTHNAEALSTRDAAILITDAEAPQHLVTTALRLAEDKEQLRALGAEALKLAQRDSALVIAKEVIKLAQA